MRAALPLSALPRSLMVALLLALISLPAHAADELTPGLPQIQKLSIPIPPGHSELDDLQKDYEKASLELQGSFEKFAKDVRSCDKGKAVSKEVERAGAWQKQQRGRISKALNDSAADLQVEVKKLDDAAFQNDPMLATVDASKIIIATGVDKPKAVIKKELPALLAFNVRLERGQGSASELLAGNSSGCARARSLFAEKIPPQAKALPEKLKKIYIALAQHKASLDAYADFVAKGQPSAARTPASR